MNRDNENIPTPKKDNLIEETIHIDNSIPTMYSLTSDGISSVKIYFQFHKIKKTTKITKFSPIQKNSI